MEKKITRRDMLKVMLAGGGGIAASAFLPGKWLKPFVTTGVLPVHAATSTPFCDSGKWWGNYYDTGPYFLSIQLTADFPEGVEFTYEVIAVTGGISLKVGDTGTQTTYMYSDGLVYVDFDEEFTISPDVPGSAGTPWSLTMKTKINECDENVVITNADWWDETTLAPSEKKVHP